VSADRVGNGGVGAACFVLVDDRGTHDVAGPSWPPGSCVRGWALGRR
jgi:hypothetical protein